MSTEQVVVPVVYGQQVPDEPAEVSDISAEDDSGKFLVRLDNFTGPFDLLLQLIGKHKLDVTEIALHQVTDDFIAYIRAMGDDWDLGETSEFLLVAATLLDLKAARLLPAADVEDEEDLALLEARDLLFARLLQYKAYKEAAAHIAELEFTGGKRWPRSVSMEPRYAEALPDLVLGVGPERLFKLALKQFIPKPGPPQVSIAHIHQVRVSVREHAALLRDRLRRAGSATFTLLVADCDNTLEVVARFLALLELYREGLIDFEQPVSLDELTVRWIGGDAADAELEIDDYEGTKPTEDAPPEDPNATDAAPSPTEPDVPSSATSLMEADVPSSATSLTEPDVPSSATSLIEPNVPSSATSLAVPDVPSSAASAAALAEPGADAAPSAYPVAKPDVADAAASVAGPGMDGAASVAGSGVADVAASVAGRGEADAGTPAASLGKPDVADSTPSAPSTPSTSWTPSAPSASSAPSAFSAPSASSAPSAPSAAEPFRAESAASAAEGAARESADERGVAESADSVVGDAGKREVGRLDVGPDDDDLGGEDDDAEERS